MLQSDLDEEDAESLFTDACASSRFLAPFNEDDIGFLAKHLAIIAFDADDLIMQRGEVASWVGIVLSGALVAFVDAIEVGRMTVGTLVGELAFFAGGTRQADVRGAEKGFIATIKISDVASFFASAPRTAYKLVRVLGSSSVYQITHNPTVHAPLAFDLAPQEAADAVAEWSEEHFLPMLESYDISEADGKHLVSCMQFHRFAASEPLLATFAVNECICFVISGTVEVFEPYSGRKQRIGWQSEQDQVFNDIEFFAQSAQLCKVVGCEPGILAGLNHSVIETLAQQKPKLALKLLRLIGSTAVDAASNIARSMAPSRQVVHLREGSIVGSAIAAGARSAAAKAAADTDDDEVLYRNRILQQKAKAEIEANKADQAAKAAKAEAEAVKEQKKKAEADAKLKESNFKLVQKRLQSEKRKVETELSALKADFIVQRNHIKDLKAQVKEAKEETKAARVSTTRRQSSMDKRRSSMDKNKLKTMLGQGAEAEDSAGPSMAEQNMRKEIDTLYQSCSELRNDNEKLQSALEAMQAENDAMGEALKMSRADYQNAIEAARHQKASLEEAAELQRERLTDQIDASKRAEAEAHKASQAMRSRLNIAEYELGLCASLLGDELQRAELRLERQAHKIELQRVAAKGLGIVYVSRLYPIKKEIRRLRQKVALDQQQLLALPLKLKVKESNLRKTEAELKETKAKLDPALAKLEEEQAARAAAVSELAEAKAELARVTQRSDHLDTWGSHLVGQLSRADVQVRQLGARLQRSKGHEDKASREVLHWASRAEAAAATTAKMAVRMVALEQSFGALLPPKAPVPKASAMVGLLPFTSSS